MKRHLYTLLIALVASSAAWAQESITTLDWEVMRIDSVVPHYIEVVPLDSDFDDYTYSVRCEYMTWQQLTTDEERVVREFADEIGDSLQIRCSVGRSRGEGFLDIDFVPIVYDRARDRYSKLMQCRIAIDSTPRPQLARRATEGERERWASSSVLSHGRWVKIAVSTSGIHAITPAQLKSMGFANAQRVKVYGYGGNQLPEVIDADTQWDDLEEIPLVRDAASGALLFWANGPMGWDWTVTSSNAQHHTLNPYSTRGYYFVTEGDNALTLADAPEATSTSASRIGSFTANIVRNVDECAFFTSGRILWENSNIGVTGGRTYSLNLPNIYSIGDAKLRISTASSDASRTTVNVTWNDNALATIDIKAPGQYDQAGTTTKQYTLSNTTLQRGLNTLRLEAAANHFTQLDFIEISYPHNFTLDGNEMPIHLTQSSSVKFALTPAREGQDIVLMRLGTRGRPATRIAPDENGDYIIDSPAGDYVAFDRSATYPQVQVVGTVANQNLHAHDSDVDMIIITPSSGIFDTQAQRLADAHSRTDGVRCRVVRADHIYNEFSSGTPDATAYRRYLKMLYDRALANGQEPPRYLLLFGDGIWDNRMLTTNTRHLNQDNFLLCFESVNSLSDTQGYVMEDYFALLDDGEGQYLSSDKPDMGVGRLPVRTLQEAVTVVNKIVAHLESDDAGPWQNLLLVLGDDGDSNSHMKYTNEVSEIVLGVHPYMDTRKLMWDSFKRETTSTGHSFPTLTRTINEHVANGALMVNYVGHGATYLLSHEAVITLADVYSYTNRRQALWFTAACDIAPFDGLADNIGEAMTLNPNGGSLIFIGTARTVYANLNRNLNNAFCRYLFAIDAKTGRRYSVGDALRLAKCDMGESGTTVNKLQYVLLGDPSIVLGAPLEKVIVETIDGIDVEHTDSLAQLKAGAQCTIEGRVVDAEGNTMSDFNGTLSARILDNDELIICPNQSGEDEAYQYREHRKVLYEGEVAIADGRFSITFVVPMGINYSNETGRAVFFATGRRAEGGILSANGSTERYLVGGTNEQITDTEGPTVHLWLDREAFADNSFVSAAPTLYADISDNCGLNFTAAALGQGIEVSVDDRPEWTFTANDAFVFDAGTTLSGRLTFHLPVLTEGSHTLRLHVCDVLGNRTTTTTNFRVTGLSQTDDMAVFTKIDSNNAIVSVVNRLTGAPVEATVLLYDATGKLCYTATHSQLESGATTQFVIPMNGEHGALVSGIYFMQARLRQNGNTYQLDTQKIILSF